MRVPVVGPRSTQALGTIPDDADSFFPVLFVTAGVGVLLSFGLPALAWLKARRYYEALSMPADGPMDASVNWGLIQNHRAYDATRSTINDAHYAVWRAVRRFLRMLSVCCAVVVVLLAALIFALLQFEWTTTLVYVDPLPRTVQVTPWPLALAAAAAFLGAGLLTLLSCVVNTFHSINAVGAMALLVGACPTVDLTPMLTKAEHVAVLASTSAMASHGGVAITSACLAIGLMMMSSIEGTLLPSHVTTVLGMAAVGHHVAANVCTRSAVTLFHAVDDAIDLTDKAGRHAMSHGILSATIVGNACAAPTAVSTVMLDVIVAFTLGASVDTWTKLVAPVAALAAATLLGAVLTYAMPYLPFCSDVSDAKSIPWRMHTLLWLVTAGACTVSSLLLTVVSDYDVSVVGFTVAGGLVSLLTIETAQLLARGPLVRRMARASLGASTSAALASVESLTLTPALIIITAGAAAVVSAAHRHHGTLDVAALALGAVFPAVAVSFQHGVGVLCRGLSIIAGMVPFNPEQTAAVDGMRPPRDQAATTVTIGSTVAGCLVVSLLLELTQVFGIRWGALVGGALLDAIAGCITSFASVGAQTRTEPRDQYGYGAMVTMVPRTQQGTADTNTDRPPNVMTTAFRHNVLWCVLLAPTTALLSVAVVAVVGFSAGGSYALSLAAGQAVIAYVNGIRTALAGSTMRSLNVSVERGKLGPMYDASMCSTADVLHDRRVARQSVMGAMAASTTLLAAVTLTPYFSG